jgi:hypothetical protein
MVQIITAPHQGDTPLYPRSKATPETIAFNAHSSNDPAIFEIPRTRLLSLRRWKLQGYVRGDAHRSFARTLRISAGGSREQKTLAHAS